ncbi:hypothetical protein DPMN_013413 [Dreissena polymorpha]|uniref:Uncharacterized protein n=1 Tax=Dreissena polymorpha TaxID=45954 RepID=A0A9D4N8W9_DREPO|nr:hypothetical protein DPMN_013413 [Dreissena polymorpha]
MFTDPFTAAGSLAEDCLEDSTPYKTLQRIVSDSDSDSEESPSGMVIVRMRIVVSLHRLRRSSEYRHPSTRTFSPSDFTESQNLEGSLSGMVIKTGVADLLGVMWPYEDNRSVEGRRYPGSGSNAREERECTLNSRWLPIGLI